ncbi:MAG: capsular biosynthesis protein [Lachnospiraceae bacterium]|jgi:protein-tyrosine phosphatase|nr:capsular biosynthesis protein [Lachnospiraceae bacterium]
MFIDIHNHILFGVDDGAEDIEESFDMLEDAKSQGAEAVILTPHYRHGMFGYPLERIEENYQKLDKLAAKLGISLYLGCEYHVNSEIVANLQDGRCRTLAGSDYVLMEYSYQTEYSRIADYTGRLLSCGYIPVIAHVERYKCLQKQPSLCGELANRGAMIQINADSILGIDGRAAERFCKKLLKNQWADVIASDAHGREERRSHMAKCQKSVEKAYGMTYADRLFMGNPLRIINNG